VDRDVQPSPLVQARRLWDAYARDSIERFLALVPEDATWQPLAGDGIVLRGRAALSAYLRRQRLDGGTAEVVAYRFEEHAGAVLVCGTLRRFTGSGFSDSQPAWLFFFEDGRLARAVGYPSEAEARETLRIVAGAPAD
jgi:ketosteroid isomerase-like protein